jgi:tyrosyl-tRNA synthetase
MKQLFDLLMDRGFIYQFSDNRLIPMLNNNTISTYCGFDPTADSLHLGHLVPVMLLSHLQKYGHQPIMLVGGATGLIGDPSGRSGERELLSNEQIERNVERIREQLKKFVRFDGKNPAVIVNNFDWLSKFSHLDWLREVGKYFTINYMLAKDSVKMRLEDREQGISYTEFSYMLLQSYDFYHLFKNHNCVLQCGGSDQWGNITAGIEYIRKTSSKEAYGLTVPLITTASGEKFGKSEGNAIWLAPEKTSVWDFYQYWVRVDDRDVTKFLKLYTYLTEEEIDELEQEVINQPEKRVGQKALAKAVTSTVHGLEIAKKTEMAAEILYSEQIGEIETEMLFMIFKNAPLVEVKRKKIESGIQIVDFLTDHHITSSKGEARRLLSSGAIYINNIRINAGYILTLKSQLKNNIILLRKGKKNYWIIKIL